LNPAVFPAQFFCLFRSDLNDTTNRFYRHLRERQIMPRRKADDPAIPGDRLTAQKPITGNRRFSIRQDRSEIVGENIGGGVYGIFRVTGALVARTEIALGVVRGTPFTRCALLFALPRALGAMGETRIQSPVSALYRRCGF